MAKVVRFHEIGGLEVLMIEEADIPSPGKSEVQVV
jgi:NADPH:quinone reductase-like Zn-dependent oxidoreductase